MSRGCCLAILKLLWFGEEKGWLTLLLLCWKESLQGLNWNKGVLPGTSNFFFWQDSGLVRIWKVSTGVEGTNQDRFCFSYSDWNTEYAKEDAESNWLGLNKEGEDWDVWIFLTSFKIYSGSETPKSKGEAGFPLVPIFLVATVNHWLVKM